MEMENKTLKIGIDLDNTITASEESIVFFSLLTNALKGQAKIYIITNRDTDIKHRKEIKDELFQLNIYYDELAVTAQKAEFILFQNINIYFDDVDEYFLELPESVTVLKIREPGNFDFINHKWIYGEKTGRKI